MAIELYSGADVIGLRRAGQAAAATLIAVGDFLKPGLTTKAIDQFVREDTERRGGRPSQLGYKGFPAAVCVSRNDVVCHGIPSRAEHLCDGDVVNVDITTELDGFHGDTSVTFLIGEPSEEAKHVVRVSQLCLHAAIALVRPGARLGDLGAAIQDVAHAEGCSVVEDFCGHGIGRQMHQDPQVFHVGQRGRGARLRPGMAFTIEPMINLGTKRVVVMSDGWTAKTADGRWSAQFEHTVLVTESGCEVLTARPDETVT